MLLEDSKTTLGDWFDTAVANLRADELQMETGTASPEKTATYDMLLRGNDDEMAEHGKRLSDKHFFLNILKKYVRILFTKRPFAIKSLAFSYCDSQILVWAEVYEGQYDATERALIMAEAEVNAIFFKFGYTMTTTIVEDTDGLEIPSHYALGNDEPLIF